MLPFERFKKLNTEGNLWIYILKLAKEDVVLEEDVGRLVFEKFGFLPNGFLIARVIYRLKKQGFLEKEKYKGRPAIKITKSGEEELEKMKNFCQDLLQKI